MALPLLEKDLAYISKLDTYPNDVGGMSAEELKAAFDAASQDIQNYINKLLIPQIESDIDAASQGVSSGEGIDGSRLVENSVPDSKIINLSGDKIDNGTIGTEKHKKGSITRELLSEDAKTVQTEDFPNNVVPGRALADNSIPHTKYGDGSIKTAKYEDASITTPKIANGAVTTAKIAKNAVTVDKIAPGAVGATQVASDAIDTTNIKDGAITQGKLASSVNLGVSIKKLWENASPTSEFAAQTISLNLSGYDLIKIIGSYDASNKCVMSTVEIKNVTNQTGYISGFDGSGSYVARRQFKRLSSGIQFLAAVGGEPGSYTTSTNNYMCVPLSIYGMKGVT